MSVLDILVSISAGLKVEEPFEETPKAQQLLALQPQRQVSVAISVIAAHLRQWQVREQTESVSRLETLDMLGPSVVALLRRRKLPYTADDALLLLRLAGGVSYLSLPFNTGIDFLAFALSATRVALDRHRGHPGLIAELDRLAKTVGEDHTSRYGKADLEAAIQALRAEHLPGSIVDLSLIDGNRYFRTGAASNGSR